MHFPGMISESVFICYKGKTVLKKKIIKILITGMLLTLTGCMSDKEHKDLAKELLEDKYDEDFVINKNMGEGYDLDEGIGKGFKTDEYTVEAYSADYPEIIFDAVVFPNKSKVSDPYAAKRILYSTARQIEDNIDGIDGKYFVHIIPIVYDTDIDDPDADIEELVDNNPKNSYTVYLFYCPDDEVDKTAYRYINNMFEDLECMSGKVAFYVVDKRTLSKAEDYIEENKELYQEFRKMTDDYRVGYIEFEDGELDIDEAEFLRMAKLSVK